MIDSLRTQLTKPKVLLADTDRRSYAARLALVLSDAGCEVSAICSAYGHPLLRIEAVERTFIYNAFHPLQAVTRAIEAVDPDLVLPCDDRAVQHLHQLHARTVDGPRTSTRIASLIERSLGSPKSYATVSRRYELLQVAQAEGLRVPRTIKIHADDVRQLWSDEPFPLVLKADESWGGRGVRIAYNKEEVEPLVREIGRPFRLGRALKRMVVNRDPFWMRPWWEDREPAVVAQAFVRGRAANCAVFCWEGHVLAGSCVEVLSAQGATGPAKVVRMVDNREMMHCAERLARTLQMSGFFGLDFVIEGSSSDAYLIEMNPRTTPLCHLQLGMGRDMISALWSKLSKQPMPEARCVTDNELIAYFPQPGDSQSELLALSYHDVPRGSPEFLQEFLKPWPERSRLFRLAMYWDRINGGDPTDQS